MKVLAIKTIEVLKKITSGKELVCYKSPGNKNYYEVTQKQFDWALRTLCSEWKDLDVRSATSLTDEDGNVWTLNYANSYWNVPHYIPNRKKYGKTFYIGFNKPQ